MGSQASGDFRFIDAAGQTVQNYNPKNYDNPNIRVKHQIGANEELIGVYGIKNASTHFITFGLIVKVTEN